MDEVITAVAWAGYSNAEYLAKFSIEETGMGLFEDRVKKIHNKTRGTLRDLKGALSKGITLRSTENELYSGIRR